jgi:hypothetical protein
MERRLYDNSQFSTQYHGRTDGHYGVIQSITRFFKRSRLLLHLLCISSDRSDGRESTAAGQKPSFLLQNTPYALCFFGFSSLGFCFYLLGQPVLGVLRFSSARDPRWLAMRWSWDTWVGSARSGGIYTSTRLASLIFNQNVRFIALHQDVALPVLSCSQFLPIKHFKPLHSPS